MTLPNVINDLIKAQSNFDSAAYASCFSETAEVHDEGKTYKGRFEIENWISNGNEKYKTVMKPLGYAKEGKTDLLSAKISGTFDGSPVVLKYHFEINDGLIQSLKITG